MRAMFLEHVNEFHRHAYHVFTDRSKDPNGVGSAAVSDSRNILRKLCPMASIFTAELQAIADALIFIDDSNQDDFVIFSDFMSSLQAIEKYNNNHPIVIEIILWLVRLFTRYKRINYAGSQLTSTLQAMSELMEWHARPPRPTAISTADPCHTKTTTQ